MSGQVGIGFYEPGQPTTREGVYDISWGKDIADFERYKAEGSAGITLSGAFNAIYGPMIQNLAYNKHNTLAAIGTKAYATGYRFQLDLSKGVEGNSGVIRGGKIPAPEIGVYKTVEQPYKTNQMNFQMEVGMVGLGGIDDVLKWEQLVTLQSATWLNNMNKNLLRRIEDAPAVGIGQFEAGSTEPITSTERVNLESIERIISNCEEAQYLPDTYAIPWYINPDLPSSNGSGLAQYRGQASYATEANRDSNFDCYVDANYTTGTQVGAATLRQLNLGMIDEMFNACMPFWDNNTTAGKVLVTGYDTHQKLQGILQPQQRYNGTNFAKISVNGISTVEGTGVGFQVASYNGVPILPDRDVRRGTGASTASPSHANEGVGRMYLMDGDYIFKAAYRAPMVSVWADPLVVGSFNRRCLMYDLSEIQSTMFRPNGKIVHIK